MRLSDLIDKYDKDGGFQQAVSKLLLSLDKEDIIEQLASWVADTVYNTAYGERLDIDGGSNVRRGIEESAKQQLSNIFMTDSFKRSTSVQYLSMRIVNFVCETVGASTANRFHNNDVMMDYVEDTLRQLIKHKEKNGKLCRIVNGQFSWNVYVDNETISFTGFGTAQYFADHYRELGYSVEIEDHTHSVK